VHSYDVYQREGDAHGSWRLSLTSCGNFPNQPDGDEKHAQADEKNAVLARAFGVSRETIGAFLRAPETSVPE
jgi:hypothetical protein